MRGIDSIAKATTPRSRRRAMPSVSVRGWRNPISTVSGASAAASSGDGGATRATTCEPARSELPPPTSSAPASSYAVVEESRSVAGAALDPDLEARVAELGDRLGDERHATLAGSRLPRNRDSHAERNSIRTGGGAASASGARATSLAPDSGRPCCRVLTTSGSELGSEGHGASSQRRGSERRALT